MHLDTKIEGILPIYYFNLGHQVERQTYMEEQFKDWGVSDFHRVEMLKFWRDAPEKWEHLVHNFESIPSERYRSLCVSLSYLDFIRGWFENTKEKYLFMMEDDTDISLIKYWRFDWNYLLSSVPYDWDGFQLGFNSKNNFHCFLHPKTLSSYNGPIIITRYYAEKLIRLYFYDGKYNFTHDNKRINTCRYVRDVDDFLGYNGKIYQIPVFAQNTDLDETPREHHIKSRKACYKWWTEMQYDFSVEDFFHYGKPNDYKMLIKFE